VELKVIFEQFLSIIQVVWHGKYIRVNRRNWAEIMKLGCG